MSSGYLALEHCVLIFHEDDSSQYKCMYELVFEMFFQVGKYTFKFKFRNNLIIIT